jgi:glycosyltransferase involved in cell wall biosynthesis
LSQVNGCGIVKIPLISCIVPVYNCERYLGETLDSVLAQTYEPLEIIVVDDGSTDQTAAIAARYAPRVHYLWEPNAGEAAARNRGLSAARGDFVAFVDADDLWHPDKLQRQVARFVKRPEIDLCFTCFQNFWIPELVDEQQRHQGSPLSQRQTGWSTSTILARQSVFTRFGKFIGDGSLTPGSESMIWFLHASERGAIIETLPEILMYRRMHFGNVSRNNPIDPFFSILKAWRDYRSRRTS